MFGNSPQSAATKKTSLNQWKKLILIFTAASVVVFSALWFTEKDSPAKERKETPTKFDVTPKEADIERYKAMYDDRLRSLEESVRDSASREARLNKEIQRLKDQVNQKLAENNSSPEKSSSTSLSREGWPPAEALNGTGSQNVIGKNAPNLNRGFTSGQATTRQRQAAMNSNPNPSVRLSRIVITDVSKKPEASSVFGQKPEENMKPSAMTYLPSGTFARARLLNGAIAPTRGQGSGNPVPILLELTDAAVMPNLYRSGIKRCFVTANATGELASERVLVRLDRLSCIDENGGAVDTKIQGYVSGEDGKTGLRARLVTKSGQAIANALFTGTLSGLGKAVSLAAEDSTTSITGTVSTTVKNPWRAGLGEGTSHAMDRITDYYLKLASDMFPVLEVDSGRNVEIVISQGLSIERLSK